MRRFPGMVFAGVVLLFGTTTTTTTAKAQIPFLGDPAGFGRWGVSNGKGYGVNGPYGSGYYTGLRDLTDNQGPSFYYESGFGALKGTPRDPNNRDWSFSPPWSASYRQGQPRKRHLAGLLHRHQAQ